MNCQIKFISYSTIKFGNSSTVLWEVNDQEFILNLTFAKDAEELCLKLKEIGERLRNKTRMADLRLPYSIFPVLFKVFPEELIRDYILYWVKEIIYGGIAITQKYFMKQIFGRDDRYSIPQQLKKIFNELNYREMIFNNKHKSCICYSSFNVKFMGRDKSSIIWDINGKRFKISRYVCTLPDEMIKILKQIKERLENKVPMPDLCNKSFTLARIIYGAFPKELLKDYITYHSTNFNDKGIKNQRDLGHYLFSIQYDYYQRAEPALKKLVAECFAIEYQKHCKSLIENNKRIDINKDIWELSYLVGSSLRRTDLVFSNITRPVIRKEIKHYCLHKTINMIDVNGNLRGNPHAVLNPLKLGVAFLLENYPSVNCCADITQTMVRGLINYLEAEATTLNGKKLKPKTMTQVIAYLREFVNFVADNSNLIKTKRPKENWFNTVDFHNIHNLVRMTEYIPEEVVEGLLKHIEDLLAPHQRLLIIMLNGGLRFKETTHLEEDCLTYDYRNECYILSYIPYKVLESRRFHGLDDYHRIPIQEHVAQEIKDQMQESKETRVIFGLKQIFVSNNLYKANIIKAGDFNNAINRLIRKHRITDAEGNLWYFTSQQCRKTLAVDMITNGAKPVEVQSYLGHLHEPTTRKFYAEVRRMRLADMNAEFFKKKFESFVTEEQLGSYSEEERRALYVEFCLGHREVELGKCIKKFSDGPCSKRAGKTTCAICRALITGPQKLPRLIELLEKQRHRVNSLVEVYENNGITEYTEYREYQREKYFLEIYHDLVDRVIKYTEANYGSA